MMSFRSSLARERASAISRLLRPKDKMIKESAMKAMVYHRYGSPDVLELQEVEKPIVNDDQVLPFASVMDTRSQA